MVFATPSLATTITLASGQDNTLYESSTGHLSNGAGTYLFAGTSGSGRSGVPDRITRALLAFDLSSIPAGVIINSVELSISVGQGKSRSGTLQLHKVGKDWGEGTSFPPIGGGDGAPDTPGDATWIHTFSDDSFWTNPGGE